VAQTLVLYKEARHGAHAKSRRNRERRRIPSGGVLLEHELEVRDDADRVGPPMVTQGEGQSCQPREEGGDGRLRWALAPVGPACWARDWREWSWAYGGGKAERVKSQKRGRER